MCSCLKLSLRFQNQLLISNRKYFSVFSRKSNILSSKYDTNKTPFREINKPNQIQLRCLSMQSFNSFYELIYTSEATKFTTNILVEMHDFTDLSWSTTILASSILMKSLIGFPCAVYQRYLLARLEQTQIELKEKVPSFKKKIWDEAIRGQWTKEKTQKEFKREIKQEWKNLVVKNNCHPFKTIILFFIQFPFWLLLSFAIRAITLDVYLKKNEYPLENLQFQTDGPFWCPNLLLPDPTFILPAVNFLSMLAIIEISVFSKSIKNNSKSFISTWGNKIIPNFMRLFAVAFFFTSAVSPSALSLFWSSSSLFALGQTLLLMSPKARRFLKIPKVPSDIDKPYRFAFNNFIETFLKVSHQQK